jgi:aryl sulfotransferase
MTTLRAPERAKISYLEDSRRWSRIERRPDDIVISTPPKSGTTWMQGIVTALLWPEGDAPDAPASLSPWVDFRLPPIDELVARLDAQDHRRFLKTHTSADGFPVDTDGKTIVVYRDGRDALMSWSNHRATTRPELVELLNQLAADDGVEPLPPIWTGDMDQLFDEWVRDCSPIEHLDGWWPLRHEPFVLFVHYNDLSADLPGEMRRIADFLELDVADAPSDGAGSTPCGRRQRVPVSMTWASSVARRRSSIRAPTDAGSARSPTRSWRAVTPWSPNSPSTRRGGSNTDRSRWALAPDRHITGQTRDVVRRSGRGLRARSSRG